MLFGGLFDRPPPDGFPVVDGHPAGELPPPWPFPAPGPPPLTPPLPLPLLPPLHVPPPLPPPPPPLRPPRRARTCGIASTGAFAFSESSVHVNADAGAASQTRSKATTFIIFIMRSGTGTRLSCEDESCGLLTSDCHRASHATACEHSRTGRCFRYRTSPGTTELFHKSQNFELR